MVISSWFERLTMTVILVNCVTLGMYSPCTDTTVCNKKCFLLKVSQHGDLVTSRPQMTVQTADALIYVYFAVEMFIKMVALGVMGRGCYLQETWNKLDCFIVLSGAFEYLMDVEKINLSAIRTVRVLRPLKAINRIPSMR